MNASLCAGKKYEDKETETYRRLIWEFNLEKIERHNALADRGVHSFHLGMNHYGDLVIGSLYVCLSVCLSVSFSLSLSQLL